MEVVSTPDFSTALEAMCFVQQLRLLLMHHGICKGEMHSMNQGFESTALNFEYRVVKLFVFPEGHLRVDANVSLTREGKKGVRTEVCSLFCALFIGH